MATAIPKLSLKRLSVPSRVMATIFFRLIQICLCGDSRLRRSTQAEGKGSDLGAVER